MNVGQLWLVPSTKAGNGKQLSSLSELNHTWNMHAVMHVIGFYQRVEAEVINVNVNVAELEH